MSERRAAPRRRQTGGIVRRLLVVLVLAAVAAITAGIWMQRQFNAPGPAQQSVRVQVSAGSSVRSVLMQLGRFGVIRYPHAVELYQRILARIQHRGIRLQAGEYEIPAGASPAAVLALFDEGRVVLEQITVIEGSTFADFRRALEQHAAVTHTLAGKSDTELMNALGHPGPGPEGLFFPDTYRFAAKTTDVEILGLAYAAMQRTLDEAWRQRSPDVPLQNPYEALILASIVEKETALPDERARIAGVFVARLRKGMRLQTDPAVIYGMGSGYHGEIHTKDLQTDTPFNTYTRAGLPPTPICLPGRDSILAAVNPRETGELYFVATGAGDGGHHFSRTLEEHDAAVRSYLQHLRSGAKPAVGAGTGVTSSGETTPTASGGAAPASTGATGTPRRP